jgi:transcription elongation factor GreA
LGTDQNPSLTQALNHYLTSLKTEEERRDGQIELNRFVRWCGRDRDVRELTPPEIAEYADSSNIWGAGSAKKLKPVRSFLTYLNVRGLIPQKLASHLKFSKARKGSHRVFFKSATEHAELSPEGHASLQSKLEVLKIERISIIADIQRAMEDKDFKENSPLDAAKDRQGFIEASIRELEGILAYAVVRTGTETGNNHQIRLGKRVTLKDVNGGKEKTYTLVDQNEADPISGKISAASPVGKALLDKEVGDEVHINVPKGSLHYVVLKVDNS